jgi:hypothetical protein
MLLHCSIYKYSRTSPDGKTHNQIDHILIDRNSIQVYLMSDLSDELIATVTIIW